MPGSENCKGRWCFISPIICQKGFCSECMIYLKISREFTSALEENADPVGNVLDKILRGERRHTDVPLPEYDPK